jgi:AraC-like DNA-binding protein
MHNGESAMLSAAVGTHRELMPERALSNHFDRIWFHHFPLDLRAAVQVVPDGCVDLLWVNGQLRIAGPDRAAQTEMILAGSSVVGLRFQPGAVEHWLAAPSDAFVDQRVALEDLWGAEARRLSDELAQAESPDEMAVRLQAALARRATALREPNPLSREVLRRIRSQASSKGDLTRQLCSSLGLSERTLLRHTRSAFGYGPKFLQRVLRFQNFLGLLRETAAPCLASLALDSGYADQAHLSRESLELSGFTPSALLRQFAPFGGFVQDRADEGAHA